MITGDFTIGFFCGGIIGFIGGCFAVGFAYIEQREKEDIKKIESMIDWIDR